MKIQRAKMQSVKSLAAALVFCAADVAAQAHPVRTDFAYGLELAEPCVNAVCELMLPLSVYQHTAFNDLRDLRVFNADGEAVPHAIRMQTRTAGEETTIALPVFPLRGDVETALKSMQVQISAGGSQFALRTQQPSAVSQPVVAYLIDARAAKRPLTALELHWSGATRQFSAAISVETSDDLQRWYTEVSNAPIVNLQHEGQTLTERRIDVPQLNAKFLRLRWSGNAAPFELQSLQARLQAERPPPAREAMSVMGVAENDGFTFDLSAHVPVREVDMLFPQANTVAPVELLSRAHADSEWRRVTAATLYRLSNDGREVRNRALPVHNADRYWMARIGAKGGGIGSGVPQLDVAWEPQRLLFVARGKPPFLVAFGNNRSAQSEVSFDAVLSDEATASGIVRPQVVSAGKLIELGGTSRLALKEPTDWKRWLLWLALALGVALLIGMARHLLREMNSSQS